MTSAAQGAEVEKEETVAADVDRDAYWLRLARDAFSSASTYFDTAVRSRIIQDIRQFQGEHPEGSKYFTDAYRLRSKLFRPKTRAAIRKNEATAAAAFFATEDVVAVRPEDDDDDLHRAAALFHKTLLQYRLSRPKPHGIPWFITCLGAYQEADAVGVVASHQDWLKDEDRPEIRLLPIENYRFDAAADWRDPVGSSPYFIIQWPMYVCDVRDRMVEGGWRRYSDADILAASKNSSDTIRLARESKQGVDSKGATNAVSDFTIVWVHENFIRVRGIDAVFFTLGTERILSDPIPVTERYPQGRPVVIGFTILEAHKAYKPSVCSLTREVQSEINDVANERRHAVRLANEKRYIVKRGSNTDLRSLTRNIPASVTLATDPNDVRVVTTDDATASAYQEQDRLNLDFDDLAGTFSGSSVASNRRLNETVGGMSLLSADANKVSEYQLRTFAETWVENVLRQLIVLVQSFETNDKVLTLAARKAGINGEGLKEQIEELIVQDVILNVNVGTGAVNPQTQLERFVFAMQSLAGIIGPDFLKRPLTPQEEEIAKEIFGKCGYKDGARFLQRAKENEDPRLLQLMQTVEQLQQALAAKNPPEMVEAQAAKLKAEAALKQAEAVNKRVEALFSAMNTAQVAVTVPGVTPVADAIAASAGFEDQDGGTAVPQVEPMQIPEGARIPQNSSPMLPANPGRGMMAGLESGELPADSSMHGVHQDIEQVG